MKKIIILGLLLITLFSFLVVAQEEEHDFTKAKQLIDSKVTCDKLTNEQLEEIGDYYMEQMHPGEAHEYMDRMMGGEGSESLKQVHINIARRIYCNENVGMRGGGMMMGRGMMGNYYYQTSQNNSFYGFQIFFYILLILVIVILVLITLLLINKLKKTRRK
jgi:di/tricarboxylate transporter